MKKCQYCAGSGIVGGTMEYVSESCGVCNATGFELPPKFEGFASIPRLFRDIIISEKIDGTNAQILITADGDIHAGSRNRWITPEDDNCGFAKWVALNRGALITTLGPGHHFGEWYGKGIQKRYSAFMTTKRFALFNTTRWASITLPPGCDTVPVLYTGPMDTSYIIQTAEALKLSGSRLVPGAVAEGIVVFHPKSGHTYKYTLENDGHKGAVGERFSE